MKGTRHLLKFAIIISCLAFSNKTLIAQDCKTKEELETLPGKYTDAAHYEWPAARASWFNDLKTTASKATANKVLTQIENIEKDSRKNFTLTGAVLKSTFHGDAPGYTNSKYATASYDLNLGIYEYFCANKKVMVNSEYSSVFRAYVNRFKDLPAAFNNLYKSVYYLTTDKYDSRFIALHDFLRFKDKKIIDAMNSSIGFYQDVADDKVKQGSYSTYITRHWYITRPGAPILVPVTRKEYLEALLEFYERELTLFKNNIADIEKEYQNNIKNAHGNEQYISNYKKGHDNHLLKYANYQSKYETKKSLVNNALKGNSIEWLSQPAVVCPKPVSNWIYDKTLGWSDNGEGTADTEADGIKTGSFTFSGFWDDRGGDVLYQFNPKYFKNNMVAPATPQMIELSFRYVKVPVGQKLVENFTKNFNFKAVQELLQ